LWPASPFRKSPQLADADSRTYLSCILHFLARRHEGDEGFIVTTQCLGTRDFVYFTRTQLNPGETLRLKIVSGSHALDVRCVVQTIGEPGVVSTDDRGPVMSFLDLTDYERRVIHNMMQRFKANIASA
jgi:hypothetical protein